MAITTITRLFPLWAILLSFSAWLYPELFTPSKQLIVPLLSLVMFGMGLTLHFSDFIRAIKMPKIILLGIVLQYSIMPLSALLISVLFHFDTALIIGMVLVGTCPGGTASNVICYLAHGNVALSITLTAISTILAVLLTPLITLLLLDRSIDVPAGSMLLSILKMVIIPVTIGLIINHFFHQHLKKISHYFPAISVAAIVYIIAIIVALNAGQFEALGLTLLAAVILHNLSGLLLGYSGSRLLGHDETTSRTLAIEVGMQNSGLAVALAFKYFPALSAFPGALFSIWHNLSGSLLAAYWSDKYK
jgi:BASS family bile acid:Na+ symporter